MTREGDKCGFPDPIAKRQSFIMGKIKGVDDWWIPLALNPDGSLVIGTTPTTPIHASIVNNVSWYNKLTRSDVRKISVDEGLPTEYWLTSDEIDSLFDEDFVTGVLKEGSWKLYFMHPLRFWHSWVYIADATTGAESTITPTDGVKTDIEEFLSVFAVPAGKRVTEIYVEKIPDTNSDTCDGSGNPIGSEAWAAEGITIATKLGLLVNAGMYGNDPLIDSSVRRLLTTIRSDTTLIASANRDKLWSLLATSKLIAESEDCFYIPPNDLHLLTMTLKEQKKALDIHEIQANTFTQMFMDFKHETHLFYPPNDDYAICVEGSELVLVNDSDTKNFSVTVEFKTSGKTVKYAGTGKALATIGGRVSATTPFSKETIVGCGGEPLTMIHSGSVDNSVFVKINYRFVRKTPCPELQEYVGFVEAPTIPEFVGFVEAPYTPEYVGFVEAPYTPEYVGFVEKPTDTDIVWFTQKPYTPGYVGFVEAPNNSEVVWFTERSSEAPPPVNEYMWHTMYVNVS